MKLGWLSHAFRFPIETVALGYLRETVSLFWPPVGVLHTTEIPFDDSLKVFKKKNAPHFLVGADRIIQFAPLGKMSHALQHKKGTVETNRWARVQIEIAGNSKLKLWLPDQPTLDRLAALIAVLEGAADIPMKRHWPDLLTSGVTWATESNPRRQEGVWGRLSGWFGHIEVPGNDHWDPGSLNYTALFAYARKLKATYKGWL
jgi:hypothetical protein